MRHLQQRAIALLLFAAVGTACKTAPKNAEESAPTAPPATGLPDQDQAELATPLAKVGDYTITVGEFQSQINKQSPYIRPRYTSLEQKREFLDNMIRFEVLAREAAARGLDKDPDVVRTMKQVMIQKLMKDEFEKKLTPDDIPEADLIKYYEDHKAEYNRPEEVRAAAIVLANKTAADRVGQLASGPAGQTNKGFRDLVTEHSTDKKTKLRGGDLRYFRMDSTELPKSVIETAFQLKKTGDVSAPIEAGDGRYFILKQTGKRKAVAKEFESVKRQIKNRVYRDTRTRAHKDFIANLRKQAKVEILEENFAKVRIDTSKPRGKDGKPVGFEADGHGHGAPE